MAIGWNDVEGIAPELSVTPTAVQASILVVVGLQINAEVWGALADVGAAYLAAHLATLARLRGGGQVTQESVDRLSRSYANPQWLHSGLGDTAYGREYSRLIHLLPATIGMV